MTQRTHSDRIWWKRRSLLNIRNGRLVILALVSLLVGASAMLLTAYLGIR
ncbi:MAG TPA: hypothetical protein VM754_07665 [Actinomycetota bacterium]|jgi:hypothetical protein|nr:hypothetical protein [Actinomycetota bacterium]